MEQRTFIQELELVLSRSQYTLLPDREGIFPVEYEGRILCLVDSDGTVLFNETGVTTILQKYKCSTVRDLAAAVLEYLPILNNAPAIKAEGLTEPYRLLVTFNDIILAGRYTEQGAVFATWQWNSNHTALTHGHYFTYAYGYSQAKEDFALRARLIPDYSKLLKNCANMY